MSIMKEYLQIQNGNIFSMFPNYSLEQTNTAEKNVNKAKTRVTFLSNPRFFIEFFVVINVFFNFRPPAMLDFKKTQSKF